MQSLVNLMVFLGSALMIYNIIRYGTFVRTSADLERPGRKSGLLAVPLLLLIFFLIGYLVVGFSGAADLLIAAILLGGSIFVFLLLLVMYSIVDRIRETDRILSLRYEEMRAQLDALTKDSLAVFLVNLTHDEIEERAGKNLYESDYAHDSYSAMLRARSENVVDPAYPGPDKSPFLREELLRRFQEGQSAVSEEILVRRPDGEVSYVSLEATFTKQPLSGDVIALITERPCNEALVRRTLLERVLMDEYDRIAYLIDGKYRVLISNDGKKSGMLLPADREESYESLYLNYILPALPKERARSAGPNPLRLSVIDAALEQDEVYDVVAPFVIDGETRSKHFVFYRIDRSAKFYLMLLSDSTRAQEAQEEAEELPPAAPETPAPEDAPAEEPPAASAPEEDPTPALHILLVDDNAINREIAELMLTAEGWTVEQASDGAQALEKVSSAAPGTYDLVLMDVQMPVMNGYEATAAIRALPDPARAAVPILAVTANAYQEDVNAALAAGMNGHVAKPIDPAAIRAAVTKLLAER